jgi:hypothetical protein
VLGRLTSGIACVVIVSNMKASLIAKTRIVYTPTSFAELVLWQLLSPATGSTHPFKYRLAYVVDGLCVLRYDNESGKGDYRHAGAIETRYAFTTPQRLIADFEHDIARWNDENRHA